MLVDMASLTPVLFKDAYKPRKILPFPFLYVTRSEKTWHILKMRKSKNVKVQFLLYSCQKPLPPHTKGKRKLLRQNNFHFDLS